MNILNEWIRDLPQQFQNKEKIEVMIRAFARQIEEVYQTFEDVKEKTKLENAVGKVLDGVGDKLVLSRRDATAIIRKSRNYELTDELYRRILKYQRLKLSSDCTYEDIMAAISLIWNVKDIKYEENPKRSASIFLNISDVNIDDADPTVNRVLSIKPAGVAVYYRAAFLLDLLSKEHIKLRTINMNFGELKIFEQCGFHRTEINSKVLLGERMIPRIIVKKDLWILDGTHRLDGKMLLKAIKNEEVL